MQPAELRRLIIRHRHVAPMLTMLLASTDAKVHITDADGEAFRGRTAFSAVLLLHGVRQPVSGTGEIRAEGPTFRVDASFPLTLTDFGITPPEYLGVGVANRLLVTVRLTATPAEKGGR